MFHSVDRQTLWKLLRHYEGPEKITNIIKNSHAFEGMTCRVVHGRKLTDVLHIRTEERQGCLLSPFLLKTDGFTTTSTAQRRNGIQWTLWTRLNDLDFADDLALLSHSQQQMLEKTSTVADTSAHLGSQGTPHTLEGKALEVVKSFTYLRSISIRKAGQPLTSGSGSARQGWLSTSLITCGDRQISAPTLRSEFSTPL